MASRTTIEIRIEDAEVLQRFGSEVAQGLVQEVYALIPALEFKRLDTQFGRSAYHSDEIELRVTVAFKEREEILEDF